MHKGPITEKQLKGFGLLMGAVLSAASMVMLYKGALGFAVIILAFAVCFLVAALTAPLWLKDIFLGWMKFAGIVGAFNTQLALALFYFLVFTPVHLYFKISQKDPLKLKFDATMPSYWVDRPPADGGPAKYERQY